MCTTRIREFEPGPRTTIDITSDACFTDVERAGVGGFCHGMYWSFEIPDEEAPAFPSPGALT